MTVLARSELILGGQKSGKSRRGEWLAQQWLAAQPGHQACLLATAQAWDAEMHQRIARHQLERAQRVPGLRTVEAPRELAQALAEHSRADTLVLVDCLTLWLTNWLMPAQESASKPVETKDWKAQSAHFFESLAAAPGPVVLVGNEIGLGVIPLGGAVRAFVDQLGLLNQQAAQQCQRVTLMVAGLALHLKQEAQA